MAVLVIPLYNDLVKSNVKYVTGVTKFQLEMFYICGGFKTLKQIFCYFSHQVVDY